MMNFNRNILLPVAKILILPFIFAFLQANAQTNTVDSLREQFFHAKNQGKAKICNQLAYEFFETSTDSTFYYAALALEFAQQHLQFKEEAQALFSMGYSREMAEDYLGALDYYNKSFDGYLRINDKNGIASVANYIATLYKYTGHFETAVEYYNTALKYYSELKDLTGITYTLNNIGVMYFWAGNYNKAWDSYDKSLKYSRLLNDSASIGSTLNNMGLLAMAKNQLDKAMALFKESLKISQAIADPSGVATAYSNIADILIRRGKWEEAMNYLDLVEMINPLEFSATIRTNAFHDKAQVYEKLNRIPEAIQYYQKALDCAIQFQLRPVMSEIYYDYAQLLTKQNHHKEAAVFYKKCVELRDSIHTDKLNEQLSNTQFSIDLNEKESENQILKRQNDIRALQVEKWKWILLIAIISAVIILLLLFMLLAKLRNVSIQHRELENKNAEIIVLNKELTELKDRLKIQLKEQTIELKDEKQRRVWMEKDLAEIKVEKDTQKMVSDMLRRHVAEEIQSSVELIRDYSSQISKESSNRDSKNLLSFNARHIQFSLQELMVLDGDKSEWNSLQSDRFSAIQLLEETENYFRRLIPEARLFITKESENYGDCSGDKNMIVRLLNDAIVLLYRNSSDRTVQISASSHKKTLSIDISSNLSAANIEILKTHSSQVSQMSPESANNIDIITPLYYLHQFSILTDVQYEFVAVETKMHIRFTITETKQPKSKIKRPFNFAVVDNDDPINKMLLSKNLKAHGTISILKFNEVDSLSNENTYDVFFIDIPTDQIKKFCIEIGALKTKHYKSIFVAMSAYLLPEDRDCLLSAGFDFCLAKPITNLALSRLFEILKVD
jgi:tetratricopeptide (TPR) repeat protein